MTRPALARLDPPPGSGLSPTRKRDLALEGCVSVAEAEAFLGVKTTVVYGLMASGDLVYVKLGRRRVVPKRALVELLATRMTCGE